MAAPRTAPVTLPLFPLHAVLFPGGLLSLKVFEPRYCNLIKRCLREQQPMGVIALLETTQASREPTHSSFESSGVVAELLEVHAHHACVLQVRCRGMQRFKLRAFDQQADGLWMGKVQLDAPEEALLPTADLLETVRGLANAIAALKQKGETPFLKPFQFDNAGWVANRWCEILPIPWAAKQKLMELPNPLTRLQLVQDFLRQKDIVK